VLTRALSAVAVGVPYTERNFRQILDASVRALYEARGRIRVEFPQVTAEKAPKVEGLIVTTSIKEGPVYKLGSVRLAGVSANQTGEMEKAANWQKGDIANFDDIQAGVERIRTKYRQGGYLDAKARVDREVRDAEQSVNLTVTVEPGTQYKMGKLAINGLDILSEPVIRKMWRLAAGSPFQPDYPESFLARVNEEGLFDNLGKTRAEPNINAATHVVDVALFFAGGRPPSKDKEGKERRPLP
jgi:outer membrane protein insertion porin family